MTSPGGGNGFETVAVGGCLMAALLAVSRLFDQVGFTDHDVWGFLDHMWDWLAVETSTFDDWETWWNPVLAMALGDPVPMQLLSNTPLPPDDLRHICEDLAEIVYGNLFATVQHSDTVNRLESLRGRLARFGLDLPPVDVIRRSPVADLASDQGWGARISAAEVANLRSLDW